MNAPLFDDEMRAALQPWDRIWEPRGGLLNTDQFTATQLLNAGSQGRIGLNNAEASFLQVVVDQVKPLGVAQDDWLTRLCARLSAPSEQSNKELRQ